MKKNLILFLMFICFVFVTCNESKALLESEEFLKNLQSCIPYSPKAEITFDGTIVGKVNGKCHVKFPNASLTDKTTNEKINLANCYFSSNDIYTIVNISKEIKNFYAKYLGKTSIPSSEEARMKSLMIEYTEIHKKSCR